MRRLLKIVICLLFVMTVNVYAVGFNMNLSSNSTSAKVGDEVTVNISLNNISDIPNGLNACQVSVASTGLTINNIVGNGWNVTNGSVVIMDSSNSVTSSATIATIKATLNSAGNITISNISCSDGENEYSASNKSISFSVKENVLTTTTTTTKKRVQNPTSTTTRRVDNSKTTSVTTTVPVKNVFLKSLTIEGVPFEFDKNNFQYNIEVENTLDKIKFNYETEDRNVKVEMFGNTDLIVGENKFQFVVSSGTIKTTYNLNVVRKGDTDDISNNEFEILEALKQDLDILKVKVQMSDTNKVITSSILSYLKENNKNIMYEIYDNDKIIYSVKILGSGINDINKFSFNINFMSNYDNTLDNQLKNHSKEVINFDYRGKLPRGTEVTLYDMNFSGKVYLYDYNHNLDKLDLIGEVVNSNNIVLKLDKTSEYVLSDYGASQPVGMIIIIALISVLILLLLSFIIFFKVKNKNKKASLASVDEIEKLDINV